MSTKSDPATEGVHLTVSRVVNAPCAAAFRAWTDPGQLAQWFSPAEVALRGLTAEVRKGGAFRVHYSSSKGEHIASGHYQEIVPNRRLQFSWTWDHYPMPASVVTVEFEDLGPTTRVTLYHEGLPDQEDAEQHTHGWTSIIDRRFVPFVDSSQTVQNPANSEGLGREFTLVREFEAPREWVWKACTEANHLAQWWGPKGFTAPVCEWHARPGNKIHVVMRAPDGTDHVMGGEFREVVPQEKLVTVTGALDEAGKVLFEFLHTLTLSEPGGKTRLTMHSRVISATLGAGRYIGGFELGMTLSLERLGVHLARKTEPFVLERSFDAPPAAVWKAITDPQAMKVWYFDLKDFQPVVGYEFAFVVDCALGTFDHRCKITEVIPDKRLAYTWRYHGHEGDSLVSFDLFAEDQRTRLKLTHLGLESFPARPEFARSNFAEGWTSILGAELKHFVEDQTNQTKPSKVK